MGDAERRKRGEGMTHTDGRSYVRGLLDGAPLTINDKITEEARELCDATGAVELEADAPAFAAAACDI